MKFFAVTLALASFSVFAATSGTLNLKGKVNEKLSILVTPEAVALTLDLEVSANDLKVASVNEKSNSNSGYKISISSANLGKLIRTGGAEEFPYSIKYDSQVIDLVNGDEIVHSSAVVADVDNDVLISYTGIPAEDMVAGNYKDTITFQISAN